jgi:hypothetical protein
VSFGGGDEVGEDEFLLLGHTDFESFYLMASDADHHKEKPRFCRPSLSCACSFCANPTHSDAHAFMPKRSCHRRAHVGPRDCQRGRLVGVFTTDGKGVVGANQTDLDGGCGAKARQCSVCAACPEAVPRGSLLCHFSKSVISRDALVQ